MHRVDSGTALSKLLAEYDEVFNEELGTIVGYKVRISVMNEAKPQFRKPYQVPFALKERVGAFGRRWCLQKVDHSEWAALIITVPKKDGKVRVCGDYRALNQVIDVDQYPLPRVEELFSNLAGGKSFTKLDLSHAYNQLVLEEESRQYLTVTLTKGCSSI